MNRRYLFVGSNASWGTSESRRRALVRLGRKAVSVAYEPYRSTLKLLARLEARAAIGPWPWRLNLAVLQQARMIRPEIVWVERGTLIWPRTLEQIRGMGCLLVHYNTDDLLNPRNLWSNFFRTIPFYDVHITTNIPNVSELPRIGARFVIQSQLGYDDELYYPRSLCQEDKQRLGADVSFIGHWELATEELLRYALEHNIRVRIRGHNWHKVRSSVLKRIVREGPIYLDEYAQAICASKINLGVVSIWNRNQTAGRTFEIPACEGFLLAPRTQEVTEVFTEDKEAVFFGGAEELVDKVRFYLDHEVERQRITEAGHKRCIISGYSWLDRIRSLLAQVERMR